MPDQEESVKDFVTRNLGEEAETQRRHVFVRRFGPREDLGHAILRLINMACPAVNGVQYLQALVGTSGNFQFFCSRFGSLLANASCSQCAQCD